MDSRWMEAMRRGDFEAAWRETDRIELRRRSLERAGRLVWRPEYLLWNGEPFHGRRVLVRCNHGLGDTLQFVRYVPELRTMARSVTLMVQPVLLELLSGVFEEARDGWSSAPVPGHDMEIEVMELAYAFRSTPETLPGRGAYLEARGGFRFPEFAWDGMRIGLVWAASDWDPRRSIPLRALAPLCRVRGAWFYSLQQGPLAREWARAPFQLEPLSAWTRRVERAAAAMAGLDLILTVDSMTAHLAGALGRPVWLMLTHEADWRWQAGRRDSPWYPSMRIFRQPRPGDWAAVGEAVAEELDRFLPRPVL